MKRILSVYRMTLDDKKVFSYSFVYSLLIEKYLLNNDLKEWSTLEIPFRCFKESGLEDSSVTSLVSISSNSSLNIDIHSIMLINKSDQAKQIECSSFKNL